jgi:hypothetical protein
MADIVAFLPGLLDPQSQAVAELRTLLTSVTTQFTDPLRKLQADLSGISSGISSDISKLSAMWGAAVAAQPSVTGSRGFDFDTVALIGRDAVPLATLPANTSPLVLPLALAAPPGAPLLGDEAVASLGAITTLATEHSVTATSVVEPNAGSLMDVQLPVGQALGEALRSASLAELLAVALPGLGGLVFFTGAGVGLGRRQAKAGLILQASGIARFARSGPIGVVRSGSLIALRPVVLRQVMRPATAGVVRLFDNAAA